MLVDRPTDAHAGGARRLPRRARPPPGLTARRGHARQDEPHHHRGGSIGSRQISRQMRLGLVSRVRDGISRRTLPRRRALHSAADPTAPSLVAAAPGDGDTRRYTSDSRRHAAGATSTGARSTAAGGGCCAGIRPRGARARRWQRRGRGRGGCARACWELHHVAAASYWQESCCAPPPCRSRLADLDPVTDDGGEAHA